VETREEEMDGLTIGLPEAIESLRNDLSRAMIEGRDEALKFKVSMVELEFNLAVTTAKSGSGGIRFWVLSADAKVSRADSSIHRIKLSMIPIGSEQNDETGVIIADEVVGKPQ